MVQDEEELKKNLEIMGGDPFAMSNGALEKLDNLNMDVENMTNHQI